MKEKLKSRFVCALIVALTVLWLLPQQAMAEGDGLWITTSSPGYFFVVEEDKINSQNYLMVTVLEPGLKGAQIYLGPTSGAGGSTFLVNPLVANSNLSFTWHFNSNTQASVRVQQCAFNCIWQPGQSVTLTKAFGDNQNLTSGGSGGGGGGGGGGDLFDSVPDPTGASKQGENDCNSGKHKYFTLSGASGCNVINAYRNTLASNGWSVTILSSGCTAWGGGAKLEATKGGRYLFMNAGGASNFTNIDLCVWPSRPSNTDCDQDCND